MKNKILTLLAIILFAGATVSSAQQQQIYRTAYFMEGSTFRGGMNPAFRPYRGYIDLPGISNITLNLNTTSLTVDNLLFPKDGKLLPFWDKNVTWAELSKGLEDSNGFDLDFSTTLLGFGFYSGRSFWSFSIGTKVEAGFKLPKGLFEFVKVGSGDHDLKDLSVGATATASASLGYSYRLFENLTIGARANFLAGLGRASMHYEKLNIRMEEDIWLVDAVGNLDVAMTGSKMKEKDIDGEPYLDLGSLGFNLRNMSGLAGHGLTFDVGAEYTLFNRFTFSMSLLDLGYMKWDKKATTSGVSKGTYSFSGIDFEDPDGGIGEGELEDFTRFKKVASNGFKSKVYPTFIIGAEIDIFGNDLLGFGLVYMNKRGEFVDRSEFSMALTVRPAKWVSASANYSFAKYGGSAPGISNLGLALNFHACWINFFVGTDFMVSKLMPKYFIPINQSQFTIYTGIAIPLGKEKPREMRKLGI